MPLVLHCHVGWPQVFCTELLEGIKHVLFIQFLCGLGSPNPPKIDWRRWQPPQKSDHYQWKTPQRGMYNHGPFPITKLPPNFRVVRNSSKSCSLALENINLFGKEKLKRKLERKLCYGRGWWWLVPLASLFFPFLLEANMLSVRDWFGFSHVHPCVALVWPSYRIPYFVVVMGERSLMPNLIEASAVTNSLLKPRRNSENVTVGMYDIRLLNEWHPVNSRVWSLID